MLGCDVLLHCEAPTSSVLTGDMLDAADDLVEDATRFIARVPPSFRPAVGSSVRLRVDLGARAPVRPGDGAGDRAGETVHPPG